MDLVWIVYLIDTVLGSLGTVQGISMFVAIVAGIILVTFTCILASEDPEYYERERALARVSWKIWGAVAFIAFVLSLVPSKDTAYKMLAAYAGQELVQLEETKEVGSKAYQALNKILDEYLEEEVTDDPE